jgi:hypothetical protein
MLLDDETGRDPDDAAGVRGGVPEQAPGETHDQENAEDAAEGRHESSPRDVEAPGEPPQDRRGPVRERRLLEADVAPEARHHPVIARQHLTGRGGDPTLVRARDVRAAEAREEFETGHEEDDGAAVCQEASRVHAR